MMLVQEVLAPLIVLLLFIACAAIVRKVTNPDAAQGRVSALPVPRRTVLWRVSGLFAGLISAYFVSRAGHLGVGQMLSVPVVAGGVLGGVLIGELTAPRVTATTMRRAQVEIRRVSDYLPLQMVVFVGALAALLAVVLSLTSLVAEPDDLGRAGRSLRLMCGNGSESHIGPWPGVYYSVPAGAIIFAGLLLAGLTVRRLVRRPRTSLDSSQRAMEDAVRGQVALTVTAASGVLVGAPLAGISLLSGFMLLDSCGSTLVHIGGWALVAIGLGALATLSWFGAAILFPGRTRQDLLPQRREE